MSNYTKTVNFATKDNLNSGNPLKIVKGTEIDTEYNNIATAVATKTDNAAAVIVGGTIDGTAIGGTTPAAGAFTTLAASGTTTLAGALVGAVTQSAFNTVSTTLNLGGAATAVNIGAATGTATVANTTLAAKAITASTTLAVTGTSTLTGAVTATAGVTGPITSSSVTITGGSISGITDLAVADGGTGASTAAGGLNNLLPTQTGNANKYLQTDGTNATWDAVSLSTADITGTLPVANGGTGVTSSTGTGNVVLSNSPTLVTPALGTPASGVATNLTGTASGLTAGNVTTNANLTGAVTSVGNATSLGSFSSANLLAALTDETGTGSAVFATSPTLVTPALGTPSALVGTNITGTASGLTAGNVTTNANLTGAVTSVGNATSLGSFSSANLLAALTDETGTGANVFATSPTLVTPILGTPTSATLTNATGLPLSTGVTGTLPIANGGTGLTATPANGALDIGNGTGFTRTTLTAGTNITITNGAGSISIAASGGGASAATPTALGTVYGNTATATTSAHLGYQAGNSQTGGTDNVFIGQTAGYTFNLASGTGYNTFVGQAAGYFVSTGVRNTLIGRGSAYLITTGSNNSVLGTYNGNEDGLDIRTASDYVVLSDGNGKRQITMKEGQTLALDSAVPNAGTGITFPATQSASADANTLDDYEEGTWTPTIVGSSTAGTASYSVQNGRYTKTGRMVQFECYVAYSSGSGTGNLRITGLPFAAAGTTFPPVSCLTEVIAFTANNYLCPYVQNGDTFIFMASNPTGGGARNAVSYDVTGEIQLAGTYSV